MKEKRNRKLRINYGGKIQLQKLLFLIPIVIIILVFIMYREAGAYRAEEKLYTYMGEVQTEYPEGTKFQRTDHITFLYPACLFLHGSYYTHTCASYTILIQLIYKYCSLNYFHFLFILERSIFEKREILCRTYP